MPNLIGTSSASSASSCRRQTPKEPTIHRKGSKIRARPQFDQMWSNLGRIIRPIFYHIRLRRNVLIFDVIASNIGRTIRPNVGLSYSALYSTSLSYLEVEFRPVCHTSRSNSSTLIFDHFAEAIRPIIFSTKWYSTNFICLSAVSQFRKDKNKL